MDLDINLFMYKIKNIQLKNNDIYLKEYNKVNPGSMLLYALRLTYLIND